MIIGVRCPRCDAKTGLSLTQSTYSGPFRCWKCRGTFVTTIEDDEVRSCKPISEEEFEKYSK